MCMQPCGLQRVKAKIRHGTLTKDPKWYFAHFGLSTPLGHPLKKFYVDFEVLLMNYV